MDGALVLDKPEGITSHTAVSKARRILGEKRAGHIGTLDPFATGVLVLLMGRATRMAQFYTHREKTYEGSIRFGFSTDTYDRTGIATSEKREVTIDRAELENRFASMRETTMQTPPPVSAKQVDGVRAYKLARKGIAPELKPVPVTIHELTLLSIDGPLAAFRARVSSGTYIRSIAHDLGAAIGCGAHLESLRRTAVGEFTIAQTLTLEQLADLLAQGKNPLIEMNALLPEFPVVRLDPADERRARSGNTLFVHAPADRVRIVDSSGVLIALGERNPDGSLHPDVVFP